MTEAKHNWSMPGPGALIAGRYSVLKELGAGGMSIVYQARDLVLNKDVAIKLLLPRAGEATRSNLRFQQEAKTIALLDHSNIIKVQDLNVTEEGLPYIVMELLHGSSLADILKQEELAVSRTIPIMIQACEALTHAHGRGVVHRDIKPSNFMLSEADGLEHLKLVDFGIAKLQAPDTEALSLTQTGEIFGSPLYMSPEQCEARNADERCDIYSLGCVMYEAITGSPPFAGETHLSVILKHLNEPPTPITILRPDLAHVESLNAVIMHCLEKEPLNRYQTADHVKRDLEHLLTGGAIRYSPKKAEEVRSAAQGPEQLKVLVLNAPVRIGGFTLKQLIPIALASMLAICLAGNLHTVPLRFGLFFGMVAAAIAVIKGLSIHSTSWWRHRLGVRPRVKAAPLPEIRLLPSVATEELTSNSNEWPICWKLSGLDLASMNASRKHQLASLLINLLPEYPAMQIFYSSFHQQHLDHSQKDFYLVLPGSQARGKKPQELVTGLRSIGLPLRPVAENEARALLPPNVAENEPRALLPQSVGENEIPSSDPLALATLSLKEVSRDCMKINGKFAAALVVTKLPGQTSFGWWQMILGLPCQMVISTHFQRCDALQIKAALQPYSLQTVLSWHPPNVSDISNATNIHAVSESDRTTADISLYLSVFADSQEQLAKNIALVKGAVGNLGGRIEVAEFEQLDCFISCLPLAEDRLKTVHRLLSNVAATFIPFV